jgi:rod shape determining protein RodA
MFKFLKLDNWRHFDFWLFGSVLLLCIFGVAMIRSAAAGNNNLLPLVNRQIIYIAVSLVVILGSAIIDYHYWESLTRLMYIFVLIFLIIVFVAGQISLGAARWISTGLFDIQPSELAKIVIIIVMAEYFARTQGQPHNLPWILKSFLLAALYIVFIYLQPNLSMTIVIMVLWFSMIWMSGLPTKYLVFFFLFAIVLAVAAYPFLEVYQQERILGFFFQDPNARHGNAYNVQQALITIGSGGWFGQGYGHGSQVQLRYLKVRHTDFIFSVVAEEFGFFGAVVIILVLFFIVYRCIRAARLSPDMFGAGIAYGFATLLFFQTVVNVSVNLSLIPVTGLTLPFISYGGSSMLSLCLGIGLVEAVAMRRRVYNV